MTKNEIIQQLRKYIAYKDTLSTLLSQQRQLVNATIPRNKPKPEDYRPSGSRMLIDTFACTIFPLLVIIFLGIAAEIITIPDISPLVEKLGEKWGNYYVALVTIAVCSIAVYLLIVFIISGIITAFRYGVKKRKGCEEFTKSAALYQQWEKSLPEMKRRLSTINPQVNIYKVKLQQLPINNYVHPKYLNEYPDSLLYYLESGRADSIKEAINLLEVELREFRRDEEEFRYRREMLRQAQIQSEATQEAAERSRQAAQSANEAAFWGAVTTFLISTERKN